MKRWVSSCVATAVGAVVVLGWLAIGGIAQAAKLTPHSPEVERAVKRAIKFLESDAAVDERLGAKALVGLALLKVGTDPKHPKIQAAAQAIQAKVRSGEAKTLGIDIYSTGLSIIFLVTLDSSKYGPEIEILFTYLQSVQKPHGGWGYTDRETGDTSMTQYAVLSSWEATQAGFRVPRPMIEKVADWLLRTQDPSGGFAYQGTVSETTAQVKQQGVRIGMSTAAMGAMYICSNLLGVTEKLVERDEDLPRALKEVRAEAKIVIDQGAGIDPRRFRSAMSQGNGWMRANYEPEPPKSHSHYYLYALERYWSFREAAEGEKDEKWYADGARYLVDTQADDGSWTGTGTEGLTVPNTAFGTLFLLRSSQKSIQRAYAYGAGLMVGGRGLPRDVDRVQVEGGRVIPRPTSDAASRLLAVLSEPDNPSYHHAIYALGNLTSDDARALALRHGDRLRGLAEGSAPSVRVVALRLLARTRNLDYVPLFIFALGDSDPSVLQEGLRGLAYLSRKGVVDSVGDRPSAATRQALIDKWKTWYLAIRPDAEFLN